MSTTAVSDYEGVLAKVRTWTPEMQRTLIADLMRSLYPLARPGGVRGVPVEALLGIAAGEGPPPDDETVKRWIDEHRMEKYGR
jgi:hypothetical protein